MAEQIAPKVGQSWRDRDRREAGKRVIRITRVDGRYVYGRSEHPPHTRTRILRSRLHRGFEWCGEMTSSPEHWPDWFEEDVDSAAQPLQGDENE